MKADRIVLGLFVVMVGGVWLLVNLGLLPATTVRELWRFWPLLLVIWGILLLFGKGSSGGSGCLIVILILFMIFGGIFAFIPTFGVTGSMVQTGISNNFDARSMRLDLTQHAGEFQLDSHSDDSQLIKLRLQTSVQPVINHTPSGDLAEISVVDQNKVAVGNRVSRWELSLLEDMPAEITMRTGALDAEIDMSHLLVKALDIKAGAGDLTMKLGQTDGRINVQSGASSITIYIPENVGIRLHTSGALVSVNSKNARVISIGERRYESRDIDTKDAIIEIELTAAAGSVTLRGN